MKVILTEKGTTAADFGYEDDAIITGPEKPPMIREGHWSFANDILGHLTWWTPRREALSLDDLADLLTSALASSGYGCTWGAVRGTLTYLISNEYITLEGPCNQLSFLRIIEILKLLANPLRLELVRRYTLSPATGT